PTPTPTLAPAAKTSPASTRREAPNKVKPEPVHSGADATEEIFLSPRVIDRAAFESYAERLRGLIADVAAEGAALRTAVEEARRTHEALGESGSKNKETLDLSAKLLRGLTQKTATLEELLARAQDSAGAASRFEQEAERIIGAKVSLLQERITGALEEFERRLQAQSEARARESGAMLDEFRAAREMIKKQVDQNVIGSVTALREACERAEALTGVRANATADAARKAPTPGSLGDLVHRASEAADKARGAADAFARIESSATDSVQRLTESLAGSVEFTDRVIAQRAEIERSLAQAVERGSEAERTLAERAAEAARVFKPVNEARKAADESAERLRALINQAETLQGGSAAVAGEIRTLVERAEWVIGAIEPWRGVLLEQALDGSLPEPIASLVESIRAEMAVDLSKMAAAMSLIAQRATAAGALVRASLSRATEAEVIVRPGRQDAVSRASA
ncbi:MAG TPA: hypothetical protein DEB06_07290, partial [Phycisphaerales bacterium]|nr:hypothetical protein [Phycisphaerales bacterium]